MMQQPAPPLFARPTEPTTAKPAERTSATATEPYPLAEPAPGKPTRYAPGDWRACPIARLHGYPPHRDGAKPWIDKAK
ncbi:MAG: hypothetical protein IT438_16345 [Phycisphaerales bacterium]|nr:hypothetical protein [Phycisphaerales bacterium]